MIRSDRACLNVATRSITLVILCALLVPARLLAEPPSAYYVYDDLNRLVAVVDHDGNAATYTYDAVGNILRIDRFDATSIGGAVAISMFTPSAGVVGTTVQVFGTGFGATIAQNTLAFDGQAAAIVTAAPNRLVAKVPAGATTGPISVAAPLGSAVSARPFRVLGELAIAPPTATVRASGRVAFAATESGAPATVRWAVNGLTGGDQTIGTIGTDGVYTAPAVVTAPATVTITATHLDDARSSASATVTILPALTLFVSSRPLTVAAAAAPLVIDRSVRTAVSVLTGPQGGTFATSVPRAVAIEPVVLELVPSGAPRGETLSMTITGRGLTGATSLVFLRNNTSDANITVAALAVDADGTRATADISIGAGAAFGARVVQITTSSRASTAAGTGGNVFTIQ